jgi:hypothetical protein
MKALSLKQPYAELILQGRKKIELRKWNTNFRGEFLIHSSLIPDKTAMRKFGFNDLPLGSIIGKANLVDVKKYVNDLDFFKDQNLHLANSDFGSYGFVLSNVKRLDLIPAKGKLNFWEFKGEIK